MVIQFKNIYHASKACYPVHTFTFTLNVFFFWELTLNVLFTRA